MVVGLNSAVAVGGVAAVVASTSRERAIPVTGAEEEVVDITTAGHMEEEEEEGDIATGARMEETVEVVATEVAVIRIRETVAGVGVVVDITRITEAAGVMVVIVEAIVAADTEGAEGVIKTDERGELVVEEMILSYENHRQVRLL